jgi:hypothetical protein
MKIKNLVAVLTMLTVTNVAANPNLSFQDLPGGWKAMVQQTDPFDTSVVSIIQIFKGDFILQCGSMNMRVGKSSYDSFSFSAKMKYVVDDNKPVDKSGKFSTYMEGSDMVTNSRYYFYKLNNQDIETMKKGNLIKVAGSFGSSGWMTKEESLVGFTNAYEQMCGR